MNTNEMLIKAKLARNGLTTKTRDDGTKFVCQKDDAPDWLNDLCRDAHNDMMPDDFVYSVIEDALDAIIDADGDAEDLFLEADSYTRDLLAWLSSNLKRVNYVDEAAEEYGGDASEGIVHLISAGQYHEKSQILANVVNSLENLEIEGMDDAE